MVLVSAGVSGPRPSKASEESVLTSSESRWVLKLGVSAACALAQAAMIRADRSSRLTGGHRSGEGASDTSTSRCRSICGRPAALRSVDADDLAGPGIDAQLDLVAGRVLRFGLPYAVVIVDVVHARVALGLQRGFHVVPAQRRDLPGRIDLAGAGIDAHIHMLAIGAFRLGTPHAVLELQVVHLGVALFGELAAYLRFGQRLLRHRGAAGSERQRAQGERDGESGDRVLHGAPRCLRKAGVSGAE